jgi:hypothetical protein
MTAEVALDYIPRRMKELGYGDDYSLRYVHFVLNAGETRQVEATCQFYILIEEPANVMVDSDMGIYSPAPQYINQMQYEHEGRIILKNLDVANTQTIRFIQVVPKTITQKK